MLSPVVTSTHKELHYLSARTLRFSAAIFICTKSSGRNLEWRAGLAVRDMSEAGTKEGGGAVEKGGGEKKVGDSKERWKRFNWFDPLLCGLN